jgi:hypothetical protein
VPSTSKTRKWFPCRSHNPPGCSSFDPWTSQQICEKQGAQGLDCGLIQRGEKATEGRTGWQAISSEKCHERACPGLKSLVKGFQRPFTAYGVAEEHRDKIDDFIAPEAATGKAHLFFDGSQHPLVLEVVS